LEQLAHMLDIWNTRYRLAELLKAVTLLLSRAPTGRKKESAASLVELLDVAMGLMRCGHVLKSAWQLQEAHFDKSLVMRCFRLCVAYIDIVKDVTDDLICVKAMPSWGSQKGDGPLMQSLERVQVLCEGLLILSDIAEKCMVLMNLSRCSRDSQQLLMSKATAAPLKPAMSLVEPSHEVEAMRTKAVVYLVKKCVELYMLRRYVLGRSLRSLVAGMLRQRGGRGGGDGVLAARGSDDVQRVSVGESAVDSVVHMDDGFALLVHALLSLWLNWLRTKREMHL